MCKIGTDCIITSFVANHILEGDIIRHEEVLVGVADIQAEAGDHIVSALMCHLNLTGEMFETVQHTVTK
jgi:hypothetical protein